jgi:hypothetical protein
VIYIARHDGTSSLFAKIGEFGRNLSRLGDAGEKWGSCKPDPAMNFEKLPEMSQVEPAGTPANGLPPSKDTVTRSAQFRVNRGNFLAASDA